TVTVLLVLLPAASHAVTVMRLFPFVNRGAKLQEVVPTAVPPLEVLSTVHVTAVTPTLSLAVPAISGGINAVNTAPFAAASMAIVGGTVSAMGAIAGGGVVGGGGVVDGGGVPEICTLKLTDALVDEFPLLLFETVTDQVPGPDASVTPGLTLHVAAEAHPSCV